MRPLTLRYACAAVLIVLPAHAQPFEWSGKFERSLSAYGLFESAKDQTPADGFVPYDVVTPLFTDYAHKHRFVHVPNGAKITYNAEDAFGFPAGSVLVKTFSFPRGARAPQAGRRLVETRLLVRAQSGWTGAAYVWNDDQSDALLKIAGAEVPVEWTDQSGQRRAIRYLVPDMNQCRNCHRDDTGKSGPIGIKARHLNRDYVYADGPRNQLQHWKAIGILDHVPHTGAIPTLSRWDDASETLDARAAAYMEMNCAHCHNPAGLASHTRLDLRWTQREPSRRGIMKRPTSAGNASRNHFFAIVPGDPDASFLLHRVASDRPDVRMPPIGRTVPHAEAVELLRNWIASL